LLTIILDNLLRFFVDTPKANPQPPNPQTMADQTSREAFLLSCQFGSARKERKFLMQPVVAPTMANESTMQKAEIPSSDANQPQLKFVVSYCDASKRKQKAFETEDEAIDFVRTKNPSFRRDIQDADAQASARMLLDCTNRLNARGKTIKDATDFFIQHLAG